jgi:hypothetical protein
LDVGAGRDWPDYLVFFEQLETTMQHLLRGSGYGECHRTFNSHWHDDWRRRGDIVIYCLRGEEIEKEKLGAAKEVERKKLEVERTEMERMRDKEKVRNENLKEKERKAKEKAREKERRLRGLARKAERKGRDGWFGGLRARWDGDGDWGMPWGRDLWA